MAEHWIARALSAMDDLPASERGELAVAATMLRATAAPRDGIRRMGVAIRSVQGLLPDESPWRSLCCMVDGVSHQLSGERDAARPILEEGARRGAVGAPAVEALCLAQLALLALDEDNPTDAEELASRASARAQRFGLEEEASAAVVFATFALVFGRRGRVEDAVSHVKVSTRMVDMFSDFAPWYEAEARITLARALLQLDDVTHARAHLTDAESYLRQVGESPVLRQWLDEARQATEQVAASAPWPLTAAELRLLHLMPTHLSFGEIAERLFVTTNTVKSHARAIYRKLDVSSRAEAVDTAQAAGLLDEREPSE
jgi:LuxR family maltose regulon positive regulatory protein